MTLAASASTRVHDRTRTPAPPTRPRPRLPALPRSAARVAGLGAALLLGCVASAALPAATYHVAPDGDDAAAGSAAAPWRTLGKANATLAAGDTVLLHAGSYDQPIRPQRDGNSDGERIVYRAFGDGDVVLTGFDDTDRPDGGALALGEKRYVTVSGRADGDPLDARRIRLLPQRDVGSLGNVCGSEGVVIEHVYARCAGDARSCSRGIAFCLNYWPGDYETRFNVLRHSTLIGHSSASDDASDYTEDLVTLAHRSHHNLIEHNVLQNVRHSVLYADSALSHSNVIRNNIIRNPQHTALSIWSAGIGLPEGARFLVENNYLEASGATVDPHGGPGSAFQWGADELIVRYNVITQGGGGNRQHVTIGGISAATSTSYGQPYFATDGRVYHNTVVKNRGVAIGMFDFGVEPVDLGRHRLINNIFYGSQSADSGNQLVLYWDQNFATADRYIGNLFGNPGGGDARIIVASSGGTVTLDGAIDAFRAPASPEFTAWRGFANVVDADPGFADYANGDFRLRGGSRCIDAGAPLTSVAAADSGGGSELRVEDARPFFAEAGGFPAWMGVRYDGVAVGRDYAGAARALLTGVDDAGGRLLLDRALARAPGDFVWLWRDSDGTVVVRGDGPDLGAYESPAPAAGAALTPPGNFRFGS